MAKRAPLRAYIFSVARVRALENFLIRQEVFIEAQEAPLEEALRLFAESDPYTDWLLHIKDSQQLEAVLTKEIIKLKKIIGELILDRQLLGLLESNKLECAGRILKIYPGSFLQDYLRHLIDLHNIKSFLRLYLLKEPQDTLEAALVYEGCIKKEDFLKLYSQDLAALLNYLSYVHLENRTVDYAYSLKEAIQRTREENLFLYLERAAADFLMRFLQKAKYFSYGPEPVLAYYFAKVNEINLIRLIITAKLNNFPAELVKERLNNVYA